MEEKVLVPLDGSKVGEAALPYLKELLGKLGSRVKAEVVLLQVVSSLTHYVVAGEVSAQVPYTEREVELIRQQAIAYLGKVGEGLKNKGAVVHTKVMMGNAAEGIISAADESKADLIAMSTHGRTGLSKWAFGSVAEKVLRGAHVPVLLVRTRKANPES